MTSPRQLESRALNLMEALASGRTVTEADPSAAVFRSWPGPPRLTARRLAAHANSACGRDVLWVVGALANGQAAPGTKLAAGALADWLGKLTPFFDGLAPRVTGFDVPIPGGRVVALHVETTRAPFVVRTVKSCEVPWLDRGADAIRAAGRLELVRLLSPLEDLPQFEILESELTFYKNPHAGMASKAAYRWTLDGSLYVVPRKEGRVVIPLHRCRGSVFTPDGGFTSEASDINLTADKNSPAIRITESAALIEGLGRFFVYCCGSTAQAQIPTQSPISALFDLVPAGSDRAATATAALRPEPATEANRPVAGSCDGPDAGRGWWVATGNRHPLLTNEKGTGAEAPAPSFP